MARQSVSEVPQSRHSLFMRGFSGNVEMGRIRDFFSREAGKCSFDFFKQSADGTRLFVAIRFSSRATAQDVRDKYHGQEVLGCKLQISWFKDIRRYAAHTGTMVNFNNDRRPPMRNDFGSRRPPYHHWGGQQDRYYRGRPAPRETRRSPSSSTSGTSSSRSPSDRRRNSRGHSDSPAEEERKSADESGEESHRRDHRDDEDVSQSNSPESRERRRHLESPDVPLPPSAPPPPPVNVPSDWEIPLPPGSPKGAEMVVVDTADGDSSPPRPLDVKFRTTPRRRAPLLPDAGVFEPPADSSSTPLSRRNLTATLKTKMSTTSDPPALGAKFRPIADGPESRRRRAAEDDDDVDSTPSDGDGKSPRPQSASDDDQIESSANGARLMADLITSSGRTEVSDRREHRRSRRKRHRREKSADRSGQPLQSLSLVAQSAADRADRKLKISGLTGEKLESLKETKRSLEEGYKSDCETFLVVVKMLISKDPSLEDRILAGLRESLKEIGQKYLAELNRHVDQLLIQS